MAIGLTFENFYAVGSGAARNARVYGADWNEIPGGHSQKFSKISSLVISRAHGADWNEIPDRHPPKFSKVSFTIILYCTLNREIFYFVWRTATCDVCLFGREIGLFSNDVIGLFSNHVCLFCSDLGLFSHDEYLFSGEIGLFSIDRCLFCNNIGLFSNDIGLFCSNFYLVLRIVARVSLLSSIQIDILRNSQKSALQSFW